MSNDYGLKCPECGQDTKFDISAHHTVTVESDFDVESDGSAIWGDEDAIECCVCRHFGKAGDFHDEE